MDYQDFFSFPYFKRNLISSYTNKHLLMEQKMSKSVLNVGIQQLKGYIVGKRCIYKTSKKSIRKGEAFKGSQIGCEDWQFISVYRACAKECNI